MAFCNGKRQLRLTLNPLCKAGESTALLSSSFTRELLVAIYMWSRTVAGLRLATASATRLKKLSHSVHPPEVGSRP